MRHEIARAETTDTPRMVGIETLQTREPYGSLFLFAFTRGGIGHKIEA
jgi:hypothetical protein